MKTIWKILIFVGALWFIGSAMTAAPSTPDMENLHCPGCWEVRGDGNYVETYKGGHILVSEAHNFTLDEYLTNDTADGYYVSDSSGNGTMYSYVWSNSPTGYEFGYFEVVSVNGTNYILVLSYDEAEFESYMCSGLEYGEGTLKEFNELNHMEPIAV